MIFIRATTNPFIGRLSACFTKQHCRPPLRVKDVTISHLNFYVIFLLARHLLMFRGKKNTHITWGESRVKNNKLGFIAQNKNGFAHGR